MSDIESTAPPQAENRRSRFSGLHARTYEMELLLSGALVFGLIQLPPIVQRVFTSYMASLEGNIRLIGILGQAYIQLALYGLIVIFVLHLTMRGFWIGLLGLESVFPDGIRWNKLKLGPAAIKRYRADVGSLARSVERADDLCSLVFSLGFFIVFIWVYFIIVLLAAATLAFGFSWLFLGGRSASVIFWIIGGSVVGIQPLAEMVDRAFSPRVRPGGIGERIIGLMVRIAFAVSPMRLTWSTQLTLGSNLSSTRLSAILLVCMFSLAFLQVGGTMFGRGVVRLDSLTFFPDSLREQGMDPRHYRTLRDPDAVEPLTPTIQGDIITQPYLKLFIPYNPRRHNHLLAEACPSLQPLSKNGLDAGRGQELEDAQVGKAAACLGSLFEITLDGEAPQDLHFDLTTEHRSGLEGIVSFVPIEGLERGRHELTILAPAKVKHKGSDEETPEPVRHLIPFWL